MRSKIYWWYLSKNLNSEADMRYIYKYTIHTIYTMCKYSHMTQFLHQGWQAPHFWTGSSWQPEYQVSVDHPQTCVEIWTLHLYSCVKDEIIGCANIGFVFLCIGNSDGAYSTLCQKWLAVQQFSWYLKMMKRPFWTLTCPM